MTIFSGAGSSYERPELLEDFIILNVDLLTRTMENRNHEIKECIITAKKKP